MNRFFQISHPEKIEILQQASVKTGLPAYAVEKDWWVVQVLTVLFEMAIGSHLVFKGGTSLSKAWGLIERFSEDVDLAVDRSFFGFEGDLNKSQRTKLRKHANAYIVSVVYPELKTRFEEKGVPGIIVELEEIKSSDQDPVIINVIYPFVIESPGYLQSRVQIEIGCRSLHEPFTSRSILSLVDEVFPVTSFSQPSVDVPAVNPERTFLEKVFLLHEEFQRPADKRRVERLSRHLYDVYQLAKTPFAEKALSDPSLYQTIVNHRQRFTHLGGVDYQLHQPQTINPIPAEAVLTSWKADYNTMREQMIYGHPPEFEQMIQGIDDLRKTMNDLDWTIEIA
ncbi:MAG: nucleotidyl transferase AbiEii/AbiGii toxin family protein [Imperialibacter sp.]